MGARQLAMAGTGVAALALLLQIVGVATPYWVHQSDVVHIGLWRICTSVPGQSSVCLDVPSVDWVKASRAFGIIALGLMAMAVATGAISIVKPDNPATLRLAPAVCSTAGVCAFVSVGIFAGKFDDVVGESSGLDFGYSFGLCIAAGILCIMDCALFVVARRQPA